MRGMAIIGSLLEAGRPTYQPLGADRNSVLRAVRGLQMHELKAAADPVLSADLARANAEGRDILQIGAAPASILRRDRTWTVEIHVLLEGERAQRIIALTLSGDMAVVTAVQTSVRPLVATA